MTAQDIINEMKKLPQADRRTVLQHFEEDLFSDDVVAELISRKKDVEQGINISREYQDEDITSPLKEMLKSS